VVATASGFVTGVICYVGGRFGLKDEISTIMLLYILVNRTLIGFVIGVSSLRLRWAVHGTLIGMIVGLPFTAGCILEKDNVETAIAAFVLSGVYGFLVELITSRVFKAKSGIFVAEPYQEAAFQPTH
jgi:hypothetical protein